MLKNCSKCKQEKPTKMFYRNKRTKDGYNYTCIECDETVRSKRDINAKNSKARFGGQKKKVMARDRNQCVLCGSAEMLLVHHVDGRGKGVPRQSRNHNPNNLVTLCCSCHSKVHFSPTFDEGRQRLEEYMDNLGAGLVSGPYGRGIYNNYQPRYI